MITKELFIESIEALKKQYEQDERCSKAFSVILPNSFASYYDNNAVVSQLIKLLETATDDRVGWIETFVFESNFGEEDLKIAENGVEIPFRTTEDLWDLLVGNKKPNNDRRLTGFKDLLDREIREGDVIRFAWEDLKYLVVWENDDYYLKILDTKGADGNPLTWGLLKKVFDKSTLELFGEPFILSEDTSVKHECVKKK